MKPFHRLPGWLKVVAPVTFISLCLGINAIAFTEIRQSVIARRQNNTATPTQRPTSISIQNAASSTASTASQLIITPPHQSAESANQSTELPTQAHERTQPRTALPAETVAPSATTTAGETESRPSNTVENSPSATDQTENSAEPLTDPSPAPKYGHRPYAEGNATEMALVASYAEGDFHRAETLHPESAQALLEMIAAARSEGIWLVPASGFRTIAQQRTLFNAQIANQGSPEAAAKISAPPGYSEHHTGYAIDLTDGSLPQNQDISDRFADTEAYAWLLANAADHGFELSFPEGNAQGISFEPWHWRYVGSPQARAALSLSTPTLDTRNATDRVIE